MVNMDSRVHRAQRLFIRMNSLLGGDYEKKMSVVGILKQFAEDHEVEKLAYTLDLLLQSPTERKLIHDIRPFVHYTQLEAFDAILDTDNVSRRSTRSLERRRPRTPDLTQGERRTVAIKRNQGAFGFILRGHNPVYIEKVDPGSAADRAGLKRGDCLLKLNGLNVERASHNHLVKLLQGSGKTPTFEVMTMVDNQGEPIRPDSVASTVSSESSEEDCAWMNEAVIDRDGRSFKQRADHLLTKRERELLRQAMQAYNETRNIRDFYDIVSGVFDTPSKTTLWMYIIPKLANAHKDYCMRRIDVPHELLLDVYPRDQLELILRAKQQRPEMSPDLSYESLSDVDVAEVNEIASFKQQLEYILTPRERLYLKNALQIYRDKRNIYNLVEDVGSIFDTPSKRTIWFYLIPLLAEEDQEVCRRLLTNPNSAPPSPGQPIRHSSPNVSRDYMFDEDSPDFINPDVLNDFIMEDDDVMTPATPKYGDVMFHNDDFKYVEIAAEMLRNDTAPLQHRQRNHHYQNHHNNNNDENGDFEDIDSDSGSDLSQEEDRRVWRSGTTVPVVRHAPQVPQIHVNDSFDRVSPLSSRRAVSPTPDYSPYSDSTSLPDSISSIDQLDLPPYPKPTSSIASRKSEIVFFQDDRKPSIGDRKNSVTSFRMLKEMDLDDPDMDLLPREVLESDAKIVIMQEVPESFRRKSVGNKSVKSMDSFAEKARDAIQALDDALSGEDLEDEPSKPIPEPPAPPPMATNIPRAPPPPVVKSHFREVHNQMYVKRLNWEKLELPNSKNTVWAQINAPSDLDDVVKYLELEHKFSTKRTEISTSFREQRHRITILHPKKGYNISILLGHLRLSVVQLRDAMYSMNEEIFTPELLKQMLSYSPDDDEKQRYEQYNGLTSDLGIADQFGLEMVKIPGYRDRLKGMLFKANFAEKMEEVSLTMTYTRKASAELINSKRLAKILELVLAMGNHLNRGNRRIGEASAFKIYGLANLDTTKTSDGKSTFLHVLASGVAEKFPDVVKVKEELTHVPLAAKASHETINDELIDLRNVLQDIQNTMNHIATAPTRASQVDRFHEVMEHFIAEASDHIQILYSLQIQTEQDFARMLEYFGENPDPKASDNRYEIFRIFTEFLRKFEKAHRSNMLVRH